MLAPHAGVERGDLGPSDVLAGSWLSGRGQVASPVRAVTGVCDDRAPPVVSGSCCCYRGHCCGPATVSGAARVTAL